MVHINPFKPNGIPHFYQLDQSISVIRVQWYIVFFIFFQVLIQHTIISLNSGNPDQTWYSAVSNLDLHCLSMSHKNDLRLLWVPSTVFTFAYRGLSLKKILEN